MSDIDLSKSWWDGSRKSCPECSRKAGHVVFHEPEAFGTRVDTRTGEEILQSWCNDCRSNKETTT